MTFFYKKFIKSFLFLGISFFLISFFLLYFINIFIPFYVLNDLPEKDKLFLYTKLIFPYYCFFSLKIALLPTIVFILNYFHKKNLFNFYLVNGYNIMKDIVKICIILILSLYITTIFANKAFIHFQFLNAQSIAEDLLNREDKASPFLFLNKNSTFIIYQNVGKNKVKNIIIDQFRFKDMTNKITLAEYGIFYEDKLVVFNSRQRQYNSQNKLFLDRSFMQQDFSIKKAVTFIENMKFTTEFQILELIIYIIIVLSAIIMSISFGSNFFFEFLSVIILIAVYLCSILIMKLCFFYEKKIIIVGLILLLSLFFLLLQNKQKKGTYGKI